MMQLGAHARHGTCGTTQAQGTDSWLHASSKEQAESRKQHAARRQQESSKRAEHRKQEAEIQK
jgi:hypothetical protein